MSLSFNDIVNILTIISLFIVIGQVWYHRGVNDNRLKQVERTMKEHTDALAASQEVIQAMAKNQERMAAILDRLEEAFGIVRTRVHEISNKVTVHDDRLIEVGKFLDKIEQRQHEHELDK